MNEQYGGHSQVVSITAGITMANLLLFSQASLIPADSGSDRNCDIRTYGRCRGSFMYPPLPTKQTGFLPFSWQPVSVYYF